MSLIQQREWWTSDWESGATPFFYQKGFKMPREKIEDYRINKYNPLWRASVEHERMCDYLLWKGGRSVREFEVEDWANGVTKEVAIKLQQAIIMGAKYKEAYEKLLWEKNILISCICSGRTDVIGIDDHEGNTTYHVRVKELESDGEATWGIDDGKIVEGYSCYSPYSSVQYMLIEMKKWEDENE